MRLFRPRVQRVSFPGRDIHNHLLPGVDDGFRKAEDSLLAIERLAAAGCKELVFTPHMNPDVYPDENEAHFREVYADFITRIPPELGVRTSLAAEYMVVKDFEDRANDPNLLTFEDGSILIEMSYYFRSENLEQAVFNLVTSGKKPILAHPERYLYMVKRLHDFETLIDMGCRLQMNWMSLTGTYGPDSIKILRHLLSHDMYSFICTDLHSLRQLDTILGIELEPSLAKKVDSLIASY
ncbi:MAG: hypothetical protein IKS71_07565 [Bacteroidales bacterium]|nr:hypothetical protein [Bacteroidales bacterium]